MIAGDSGRRIWKESYLETASETGNKAVLIFFNKADAFFSLFPIFLFPHASGSFSTHELSDGSQPLLWEMAGAGLLLRRNLVSSFIQCLVRVATLMLLSRASDRSARLASSIAMFPLTTYTNSESTVYKCNKGFNIY